MPHRSVRPVLAGWRALVALLAAVSLVVAPATAQSVLRDAETEAWLQAISAPLVAAAGLRPGGFKVVLIGDKDINAFVAGGQVVYLNSGTILAADNANEVQGVIAHEIGHITAGHVSLASDNAKAPGRISILSLLAGLAAVAVGAGSAGMAAMMAGQQAAMGKYLSFSRSQEASADAAGAKYLRGAGITGKGYLSFFGKLRKQEYRLMPSYMTVDSYMLDHPMSADRQAALEGDLKASPFWDKPSDAAIEREFVRVKAKLSGYMLEPREAVIKYPESDQSVAAHYARAYAWHRAAYPDKANQEVAALIAAEPDNPYFRELQGQILLESGKPRDAIAPLRIAVDRSRNQPMIAALLGHALIATEDQSNFGEAKKVLKLSVARDEENPFAWYQLGIVYDREGDQPRAALATAERYSLEGNAPLALGSAEMALRGIPEGSPDWIRAQDIAMTARTTVETEKKRR